MTPLVMRLAIFCSPSRMRFTSTALTFTSTELNARVSAAGLRLLMNGQAVAIAPTAAMAPDATMSPMTTAAYTPSSLFRFQRSKPSPVQWRADAIE